MRLLLLVIVWATTALADESTSKTDELCRNWKRIFEAKKNDKNFYLIKSKMSFFEASNYCLKLGLKMATIIDEKQLHRAENTLRSKGITKDGVWIGGTNYGMGNVSKNYYWFSTNEKFIFTNWDSSQPDHREWHLNPSEKPEIEQCVYMKNFVDFNYKWADGLCSEPLYVLCQDFYCDRISDCTRKLRYACEHSGTHSNTSDHNLPAECDGTKWILNKVLDAGSCNCLEKTKETIRFDRNVRFPPLKLNWWEARNWCLSYDMKLAVIDSREDQVAIERAVNRSRDQVWVSGTDWGQHGFWYWASTGKILSKYDGTSEPFRRFWKLKNGNKVVEHCLYLEVNDKYDWRDGNCFSNKYFVCDSLCGDIHKCYCEIPEYA